MKSRADKASTFFIIKFYLWKILIYPLFSKQLLRHRIVTVTAPGITLYNSFQRHPASFKNSILLQSLLSILRACRRKPAFRTNYGRNSNLIYSYKQNKRVGDYFRKLFQFTDEFKSSFCSFSNIIPIFSDTSVKTGNSFPI